MANDDQLLKDRLRQNLELTQAVLDDPELQSEVLAVARSVAAALRAGGKIILFGNGGSAADASHIAAEFVGRFNHERQALPAISLSDNVPALSAIGNDYGFAETFSRQIEAFARPGDVVIGMSTSGRSENVLSGLATAARLGAETVAFTGADGGECVGLAGRCVRVPSTEVARTQECTMLLLHTVCEIVESSVVADK